MADIQYKMEIPVKILACLRVAETASTDTGCYFHIDESGFINLINRGKP